MPTQTFFNLPEEKRTRIIQAAIEEFATNTLENASISHIIEVAKIPRGSFYQYFTDLKDLYKYIISLAGEQKLNYLYQWVPQLREDEFDFFKTLRDIYIAGMRFAEEHPELAAIGNHFLKSTDAELKKEVLAQQEPVARQWLRDFLQKGIELGQIDPEIDLNTVYYFISALNNAFVDYYFALQADYENFSLHKVPLLNLLDQMLYVLENGLKKK